MCHIRVSLFAYFVKITFSLLIHISKLPDLSIIHTRMPPNFIYLIRISNFYPAAFDTYALAIVPLIKYLATKCKDNQLKQAWFADDSSSVGTFESILKWWNHLSEAGPGFGYHPKPSKTWLIVKDPSLQKEEKIF